MRIVIDTNVIASALFFGGKPRQLLEMLIQRKVEAYVSREIVTEYQETCDELISRYPMKQILLPLNYIIAACRLIEPKSKIYVCRDPEDDKFIECAVDARCIYIVSGDKDLLAVERFNDVQIVTVSEFLQNAVRILAGPASRLGRRFLCLDLRGCALRKGMIIGILSPEMQGYFDMMRRKHNGFDETLFSGDADCCSAMDALWHCAG